MKNRPVKLFAVVPPGLEDICFRELQNLGFSSLTTVHGGVEFVGDLRELYQANLWLRSASRLLVRVGEFRSRDFPGFYHKCRQLPWGQFVRPGQPLEIRVTSRKSRLFHTDRVDQVVREAVAQALGELPGIHELPPARLVVQVIDDHCLLSIDSSGEHLHRRGYRKHPVPAPLRENLAAGLLLKTGWHADMPLLDPLCGSGTFVIEAALLAAGMPPGGKRSFAFMDWPGFRPGLWRTLREAASRQKRHPQVTIAGRDLSSEAIAAARHNASEADVEALIHWQPGDVMELPAPDSSGLLISNPPYGGRLGESGAMPGWFRKLGRRVDSTFPGWRLALVVPDPRLVSGWQRQMRSRLRFNNGGIKVEFMCSF